MEEEVCDDVRGREDDLPPLPPRLHGEHPRQGDTSTVCHSQGELSVDTRILKRKYVNLFYKMGFNGTNPFVY